MTPAVVMAKKANIPFELHQFEHDPNASSYGDEVVSALGVDACQVFKTLVVQMDNGKLAVGIVPVNQQLDLKAMASALKAKKVAMANKNKVMQSSGYVLGGVSPIGQKKLLQTLLHHSAAQWPQIYVSAGKRGLEILLSPADLLSLTRGEFGDIAKG